MLWFTMALGDDTFIEGLQWRLLAPWKREKSMVDPINTAMYGPHLLDRRLVSFRMSICVLDGVARIRPAVRSGVATAVVAPF